MFVGVGGMTRAPSDPTNGPWIAENPWRWLVEISTKSGKLLGSRGTKKRTPRSEQFPGIARIFVWEMTIARKSGYKKTYPEIRAIRISQTIFRAVPRNC